jgi:response regulator RpfG family c-di-GMP phosphodiesterase
VVDDRPEICRAFSFLAARNIIAPRSGEAGLQSLIDHDVDVIVPNLRMLGMNGIEFL